MAVYHEELRLSVKCSIIVVREISVTEKYKAGNVNRKCQEEIFASLKKVINEGLIKIVFQKRLTGSKRESHVGILERREMF